MAGLDRKFFVVTGPPGVGKTTLGERLKEEAGFEHVNFDHVVVGCRQRLQAGVVKPSHIEAAILDLSIIRPGVDIEQIVYDFVHGNSLTRVMAFEQIVLGLAFTTVLSVGSLHSHMGRSVAISGAIYYLNRCARRRSLETFAMMGVEDPKLVCLEAPVEALEAAIAARPTDLESLLSSGELNDPKMVRPLVENADPYEPDEGWNHILLQREQVRREVPIDEILGLIA